MFLKAKVRYVGLENAASLDWVQTLDITKKIEVDYKFSYRSIFFEVNIFKKIIKYFSYSYCMKHIKLYKVTACGMLEGKGINEFNNWKEKN